MPNLGIIFLNCFETCHLPDTMSHMNENVPGQAPDFGLFQLINDQRDAKEIICDIRDLISKVVGSKSVEIFQIDRRLNRLQKWSQEGGEILLTEVLSRRDPLVVLTEKERRILMNQDWQDLPIPEGRPKVFQDLFILIPLFSRDLMVGLVAIANPQNPHMDEEEKQILFLFLNKCQGFLSTLMELNRLRSLVIEDPVTGLRNHEYFSLRLSDEIERAHRYERQISLLMIRLESLEKVLQDLPASQAETVLKQVGTILLENTRRSNVVSRFISDPDVFQLMMPEIPAEVAQQLGETLARKFSEFKTDGMKKPLEVFWGVSIFPQDAPSRQILTAKAYSALEKARRQGQKISPPETPVSEGPDFSKEVDVVSPKILGILDTAYRIAPTKSTVLIEGETGSGKEILAEFIHRHSNRKEHPLIKVNCGALPESLLESELFGHEKGSFTGADSRRVGRFELSHEGSIFLDEIGELTLLAQVKLLRILEGKPFYRLGGTTPIHSDVRIIAATNRDLITEVQKGNFREDLYYRLNVITFTVPPLRERPEDIPALVKAFMKGFNEQNSFNVKEIHPEVMDILYRYQWPGNIRELRNAVERAMILSEKGGTLLPRFLPPSVIKTVKGLPTSEGVGSKLSLSIDGIEELADEIEFPDLNERQRRIISYLRDHPYVSNQQYVNMMKVSRRTCVRDLNVLIDRKIVVREGKKKSCIYRLVEGI